MALDGPHNAAVGQHSQPAMTVSCLLVVCCCVCLHAAVIQRCGLLRSAIYREAFVSQRQSMIQACSRGKLLLDVFSPAVLRTFAYEVSEGCVCMIN